MATNHGGGHYITAGIGERQRGIVGWGGGGGGVASEEVEVGEENGETHSTPGSGRGQKE